MLNSSIIKTHCRVCGGRADGFNYNEFTCDSCKVFFLRNCDKQKKLQCRTESGNCAITISNRKHCSACRLEKCLSLGMKKRKSNKNFDKLDSTGIAESLERLIIKNINDSSGDSLLPKDQESQNLRIMQQKIKIPEFELSSHEWSLITEIQNAMKVFGDETRAQIVRTATHLSDAIHIPEIYFKWISEFCKKIPSFTCLTQENQLILFKAFCFDMTCIRIGFFTDLVKDGCPLILNSGNEAIFVKHDVFRRIKLDFISSYINFWFSLSREMEKDEIIRDLLSTQMLFKPQPRISCPEFIRYNFYRYSNLLHQYLLYKYKNPTKANQKFSTLMYLMLEESSKIKEFELVMIEQELDFARMPHIIVELYNLT